MDLKSFPDTPVHLQDMKLEGGLDLPMCMIVIVGTNVERYRNLGSSG